ncbi:MAG: hypothetical protein H7Y36_11950 [Armatimonadetes bacterium]|nr:hypothetical protein [Akkermansiaceae bacterium]
MKFILSILFFSCAPYLLHAQEATPVTCHFLCFQRDVANTSKLGAKAGDDKIISCPLPLELVSDGIELAAYNNEISFVKAQGDKEVVAKAKIPAGIKKALVMFIAAPSTKAPLLYDTFVLDFSNKGFPEDGSVAVNLYAGDVRYSIGEHRILLNAGKTAALARPKKLNEFSMAGVRFEFLQDSKWRMAIDTTVNFPLHQQQLFVAFLDPRSQRPQLRMFLL